MKKTLFITSCHQLILRNILLTGLLDLLFKENKQVVIIVPKNKVDFFLKYFNQKVIVIGIDIHLGKRTSLLRYLSLAALNTGTLFIKRKTEMKGAGAFLTHFISNRFAHLLIRIMEKFSYNQHLFHDLFKKYKPYSVFATDIQSEIDIAILNEAKTHEIHSIGMVRSWDNLTSKGLMRSVPDQLIVWNHIIEKEAVDLHQIDPKIISIVGIPHYDAYRNYDYSDKVSFFKKIGADINKRLILFVPIGDRYLRENNVDRDVVMILDEILPDDYQILIRFPPGDYVRELEGERLKNFKHNIIYDRSYLDNGNIKMTELRREDDIHLGQTLYWSDLVISGPSTLTLDSVYMNKPIILFGFDGFKKKDYFDSIKRYYDYDNFIPILKSGGVKLAGSVEEFTQQVKTYIDRPHMDEASRVALVKEEVVFTDGSSTKRLFEVLKK